MWLQNCRPLCAKRNAEDRLNLLKLLKDGAIFCSERYPEDAEAIDMEIRKQLNEDVAKATDMTKENAVTAPSHLHQAAAPNETTNTNCQETIVATIVSKSGEQLQTTAGKINQESELVFSHVVDLSQNEKVIANRSEVVGKIATVNAPSSSTGNVKMHDIWLPIFTSISWNMDNICKK